MDVNFITVCIDDILFEGLFLLSARPFHRIADTV